MPAFKQKIFEAARGLRSSLGPSAGNQDQARRLEQAEQQIEKQRERMKKQSRELKELRTKLAESVHSTEYHGINPENVIWMLGTARTGSTWLASMMEELESYTVWREPYVGELFGRLYYNWVGERHFDSKHFILGQRSRESWLKSMRSFILGEANVRFPGVADAGYLVIREPNGSIGAPLLMEALPESRMICLVRDPRDVIASSMDAHRTGSWHYERRNMQASLVDEQPDAFVEKRAHKYLWYVGNSKLAYDAHEGPKVLVKYEELRADTLGTMKRIYSELGIRVDEGELARAVDEHSWKNLPEEEKGEGKFHRKAEPGGWREDLTPEQARVVEEVTAPLLKEFYSYDGQSKSLSQKLASSRQWMRMIYGP